MEDEWEGECFGYRLVGYIVVGGAYSAGCDDEVVFGGHAAGGFDDFGFVVGDDFDAGEGDAEGEAVFGEVGGVCVDGLDFTIRLFSTSASKPWMMGWMYVDAPFHLGLHRL